MFYEKSNCAGCSKPLEEGQDIVVCPNCGTPQHRECWVEKGRCVNHSLHSQGYAWVAPVPAQKEESPKDDEAVFRCNVCGNENSREALTCIHCGEALGERPRQGGFNRNCGQERENPFLFGVPFPEEEKIDDVTVGDLSLFVQMKSYSYIPNFKKQSETNKRVSWNWAAFLLAPYWFFYRKMYKLGIIFAGIALATTLALSAVVEVRDFPAFSAEFFERVAIGQITEQEEAQLDEYSKIYTVFAAFNIAVSAAAGLVANGAYFNKAKKEIKKAREDAEDEKVFCSAMLKNGGTSSWLLLLSMIGVSIASKLLQSLLLYLIG